LVKIDAGVEGTQAVETIAPLLARTRNQYVVFRLRPVTVTVVGYIVTLLGPGLSWPAWVLNLSPFTHLAWVPAVPWAATAGIVMMFVGLMLAGVGLLAFHRRDVVGS